MQKTGNHMRILVIFMFLLLSFNSYATIVKKLSPKELTDLSYYVVRAKISENKVVSKDEKSAIYTLTRLNILEYLKGSGPREILLRRVGGKIGNRWLQIPGRVQLKANEEVILFLEKTKSGLLVICGMEQGVYRIENRNNITYVVPLPITVSLVQHKSTGQMVVDHEIKRTTRPLNDFNSLIKGFLTKGGTP